MTNTLITYVIFMNNDSTLILVNKQAEEMSMTTEKNVNKNYTEQNQTTLTDKKPTTKKTVQRKKSHFAEFFNTLDGANDNYVLGYN